MKVSLIFCPTNETGICDYWPGKKISLSPAWWKKRMVSAFVAETRRKRSGFWRGIPYKNSPMFVTAVAEVDPKTMVVQSVDHIDVVCFLWNGSSKKLPMALVDDLKERFAHHEGALFPWLGRQAWWVR